MARRYVGHARRAIEEWELLDLIGAAAPEARVVYVLAADAGLRRAEIFDLRPEDVQPTRIHVVSGKGNVSRWTINTERIRAAIAAARWFTRPTRPTYRSISGIMKRDLAAAGLPSDLSLHCLRHRFATRCERAGMPLTDLQSLLGHADLATTAIYLHDSPKRFDMARAAIECGQIGYPQASIPSFSYSS